MTPVCKDGLDIAVWRIYVCNYIFFTTASCHAIFTFHPNAYKVLKSFHEYIAVENLTMNTNFLKQNIFLIRTRQLGGYVLCIKLKAQTANLSTSSMCLDKSATKSLITWMYKQKFSSINCNFYCYWQDGITKWSKTLRQNNKNVKRYFSQYTELLRGNVTLEIWRLDSLLILYLEIV